jgi:hypothetical protein
MIVDVHVHIFEEKMWPKNFLEGIYSVKKKTLSEEEFKHYKTEAKMETLIQEMDEAGVDVSVCLPVDLAFVCQQEPELSVWKANEYVAEAQAKYPGRIVGFVGVDPQRPDATALLEKGVKEWGLRGVKIFPGTFYPSEERIAAFIKKAEELDVPILFHVGADPHPFNVKYGDPKYLDDLLLKYPKLRLIAAHFARGYEDLLIQMCAWRPNRLWADLSAWQYEYAYSPWYFLFRMRYLLDRIPNAILNGTDWPFVKSAPNPSHKKWVDLLKNLKLPQACLDMGMQQFTAEEKAKVLGLNAQKLLNL